ncbi:GNAT family N-acetyltransferase [Nocardioides sp. NPDC059952]|uniref:GNAT family N-acetyltransferase n=1 Tax=Nocardioides sp. NPDC059952 TaxID=3347014 RepID=UPI003654ACD9
MPVIRADPHLGIHRLVEIWWQYAGVAANLDAMNVEVRTITADDWSLLRHLSLRALADSPDAFRTTLAEAEAHPEHFWQQRAKGSAPILVTVEDGRGVAMGGAFTPPDSAVADIWGMWTAPEARGHGYAAEILTDLVNWCRDRDLGVRLHVTEGNEPARRLYVAHGFKPTGMWEPLREGSALRVEELQLVK